MTPAFWNSRSSRFVGNRIVCSVSSLQIRKSAPCRVGSPAHTSTSDYPNIFGNTRWSRPERSPQLPDRGAAGTESSGGSSYVHAQLRPGELVEIGGPRNNFPLAGADRYLMIAGGVGITPLLPMIRELHAQNKDWRLLYGGRSRRSMAYLAELAEYGRRVDVRPFDECGHLDLDSELATPSDNTVVYCCGPEALISAVENHCETWPAGALHVERFSARPRDDEDDLRAFELVLASSGQRFTVPAESSALDVLGAAGIDLPNACRDGVCGSCETRVLAGLPLHRDALADPDRTDIVYPCVSRSRSAELVLDL